MVMITASELARFAPKEHNFSHRSENFATIWVDAASIIRPSEAHATTSVQCLQSVEIVITRLILRSRHALTAGVVSDVHIERMIARMPEGPWPSEEDIASHCTLRVRDMFEAILSRSQETPDPWFLIRDPMARARPFEAGGGYVSRQTKS